MKFLCSKYFPFIVGAAALFCSVPSVALVPALPAVIAIELPPPDVRPVAAIELPPPNVKPVAAVELAPVPAVEAPYETEHARAAQPVQIASAVQENNMLTVLPAYVEAYVPIRHPNGSTAADFNPAIY